MFGQNTIISAAEQAAPAFAPVTLINTQLSCAEYPSQEVYTLHYMTYRTLQGCCLSHSGWLLPESLRLALSQAGIM